MLAAGKLRHRIEIQRPFESQDQETGVLNVTWVTIATVWAAIEPVSAKEFIASDSEVSKITARVTIRFRNNLSSKMRLFHRAKNMYYNIEGMLADKISGYEYLTLPVSEGVRYIGYDYINPIYVTHNGEVVTHNGEPVTHTESFGAITYNGVTITYLGQPVTYIPVPEIITYEGDPITYLGQNVTYLE